MSLNGLANDREKSYTDIVEKGGSSRGQQRQDWSISFKVSTRNWEEYWRVSVEGQSKSMHSSQFCSRHTILTIFSSYLHFVSRCLCNSIPLNREEALPGNVLIIVSMKDETWLKSRTICKEKHIVMVTIQDPNELVRTWIHD